VSGVTTESNRPQNATVSRLVSTPRWGAASRFPRFQLRGNYGAASAFARMHHPRERADASFMGQIGTASRSLSPLQLAFAQRTDAHPGLTSRGGAVFFYREDDAGAKRWLVDREGHLLDFVQFPKRGA
jgi:hypothetical protein